MEQWPHCRSCIGLGSFWQPTNVKTLYVSFPWDCTSFLLQAILEKFVSFLLTKNSRRCVRSLCYIYNSLLAQGSPHTEWMQRTQMEAHHSLIVVDGIVLSIYFSKETRELCGMEWCRFENCHEDWHHLADSWYWGLWSSVTLIHLVSNSPNWIKNISVSSKVADSRHVYMNDLFKNICHYLLYNLSNFYLLQKT